MKVPGKEEVEEKEESKLGKRRQIGRGVGYHKRKE